MTIRLTFDVFSGRPNPSVTLTDAEAGDFLKRIGAVKPSATTAAAGDETGRSTLGYRGLIVEQTQAPAAGLPQRFRVSSAAVEGASGLLKVVDASVEQSILTNASILARAGVSAELANAIRDRAAAAKTATTTPPPATSGPLVCVRAPLYEPTWWNDGAAGGAKQFNNNCYNYACDYRTDTFAQPGKASGQPWNHLVCADVMAASVRDALTPTKLTAIKCPAEGHLAALCMWDTFDYHWYRMGRDGFWSHKPGGMPVTNLDNSGHPIVDPRTANRGDYTSFCGFMVVKHGHIKLR
jgi:hypothetical protein